jgi:1-acyl-sn-glycerol-3-phosphate acyltransferase
MMVLGRVWLLDPRHASFERRRGPECPTHAPVILMSNHQSLVDIAAIVMTLPRSQSWRFVAKRELTRVPIFGQVLVASGHIIIDRGS